MKIISADILKITPSPSGQIVAHVRCENGWEFTMPFGKPVTLDHIAFMVQKEVDQLYAAEEFANKLHKELGLPVQLLGPMPLPKQKPPIWKRVWCFITFRRQPNEV